MLSVKRMSTYLVAIVIGLFDYIQEQHLMVSEFEPTVQLARVRIES